MRRTLLPWLAGLLLALPVTATEPPHGRLETIAEVASPQLGNSRSLRLYLPPGYDTEPGRRYPVLYMHDGQNLFDPKLSFSGVAWGVDVTLDALIAAGKVEPVIVVGIDNNADRIAEYTPEPDPKYGGGKAGLYTRFVVDTVKPLIDRRYRTLPDAAHTAVMGSSLGGLLAFDMALNQPQVFGSAASLSGAFWWDGRSMIARVKAAKARPDVRLYLDAGTDGDGLEDTAAMHEAMLKQGYRPGRQLGYHEAPGARHNERYWAARLALPLQFLFGRQP